MKKIFFGLVALICSAHANSIVSFGLNYTRSNINPKGLSDFDGHMGGAQAMYQYRPLQSIYAAIGGFARYGHNTGTTGKRNLFDAGAHERIGYTFTRKNNHLLLTPYTGFGYRHLAHHVKPKNGSNIILRYNEFFFPIGLQSMYDLYEWFSIGFDAVWMPQVFSTVTFNVADGARWVLKNTYKNINVALPLYFHIKQVTNLSVVLRPFYEVWEDGPTKGATQFNDPLGLPRNRYTFWGAELNVWYAF